MAASLATREVLQRLSKRRWATVIWLPGRSRHQRRVVAALYEQAAAVPCERRAVFAGGLRGADKYGALASAGADPGRYFTVSIDLVLAELARRSLIPVVAGLSPMEGADLGLLWGGDFDT